MGETQEARDCRVPARWWSVPAVCRSRDGMLAYFGYALLGVWSGRSATAGAMLVSAEAPVFSVVALACEVVSLVALAQQARRVRSLRAGRGMLAATAMLAVLMPVASLAAGAGFGSWATGRIVLPALGGIVCGLARAMMFMAWMDAFAQLNLKSLSICFSLATIGRIGIGALVELVPVSPASTAVASAAGAVSVIACWRARYTDGPALDEGEPSAVGLSRGRFPWRPVLLMLVYYPAFCLVLMSARGETGGMQDVGGALAMVVVFAIALFAFEHLRLSVLCGVALPCLCAALLGVMGGVAWPRGIVLMLAGIGFHCFYLFAYFLLFSIAFRHGVSAPWLLGLTNVPRVLVKGLAGISLAAMGANDAAVALPTAFNQMIALMVIALVVVTLLLGFGREYGSTWGIVSGEQEAERARASRSLPDRCRALSRLYGLTRREEDVLVMIAEGADVPAIAERLVLSRGTVRNHIQHVYRKFDVHSREELVQRVSQG